MNVGDPGEKRIREKPAQGDRRRAAGGLCLEDGRFDVEDGRGRECNRLR